MNCSHAKAIRLITCIAGLLASLNVMAGIGDWDQGYGTGGRYKPSTWSYHAAEPFALADGRLLFLHIGSTPAGAPSLQMERIAANGVVDPGFGSGGVQTLAFRELPSSLVLGSQGHVFLGVGASIVRLNPDGSPDGTFGTGGSVAFPSMGGLPDSYRRIEAIAPLADGGAVVLVSAMNGSLCASVVQLFRVESGGAVHLGLSVPPAFFNYLDCEEWLFPYEWVGGSATMLTLPDNLVRLEATGGVKYFRVRAVPADQQSLSEELITGLPSLDWLTAADATHAYEAAPFYFAPDQQVIIRRLTRDLLADYSFGTGYAAGDDAIVIDFSSVLRPGSRLADAVARIFPGDPQCVYAIAQVQDERGIAVHTVAARILNGAWDRSFGAHGILVAAPTMRVIGTQAGGQLLLWAAPDIRAEAPEDPAGAVIRTLGVDAPSPGVIALHPLVRKAPPTGSHLYPYSYDVATAEGTTAYIEVSRSLGSLGPVSVNYQVFAGTATLRRDVESVVGSVTWQDGESGTKRIPVQIMTDSDADPGEEFLFLVDVPATQAALSVASLHAYAIGDAAAPVIGSVPGGSDGAGGAGGSGGASGGGGSTGLSLLFLLAAMLARGAVLRRLAVRLYSRSRSR